MNFSEIRRKVIVAMFSDDTLFHQLTLKGGNALNLIYKFGSRTSIDIDLSLDSDFADIRDTSRRIFRALRNRFAEAHLAVFDEKIESRPQTTEGATDHRWGGYEVSFKLIDTAIFQAYASDIERTRREAMVIAPDNQRTFRVQISKYEHCVGKREVELDKYLVVVYTPEMIAVEKLRAICQQMPDYSKRGHPAPRARDFYDIHTILTSTGIKLDSTNNLQLFRDIFAAKEVDLELLTRMAEQREFHRLDWPSVQVSVLGSLEDFDFYFDFVLNKTKSLEALWVK